MSYFPLDEFIQYLSPLDSNAADLFGDAAPLFVPGEKCQWPWRGNRSGIALCPYVYTGKEKDSSGFIIPVRWVKGTGEDLNLPVSLREVSQEVLSFHKEQKKNDKLGWHIVVDMRDSTQQYDFSKINLTSESAWLPLAVALESALLDVPITGGVATTGSLENGILTCGGVKGKAQALSRLGITRFFVPGHDGDDIDDIDVRIERIALDQDATRIKTIQNILKHMAFRPSIDAGSNFDERCTYATKVLNYERTSQEEYIRKELKSQIVERLGEGLPESCKNSVVLIVSDTILLGDYACNALAYESGLLVISRNEKEWKNLLQDHKALELCHVTDHEDLLAMTHSVSDSFARIMEKSRSKRIVVDITGGTRIMVLATLAVVQSYKDVRIVVIQSQSNGRIRQIGTEKYIVVDSSFNVIE